MLVCFILEWKGRRCILKSLFPEIKKASISTLKNWNWIFVSGATCCINLLGTIRKKDDRIESKIICWNVEKSGKDLNAELAQRRMICKGKIYYIHANHWITNQRQNSRFIDEYIKTDMINICSYWHFIKICNAKVLHTFKKENKKNSHQSTTKQFQMVVP